MGEFKVVRFESFNENFDRNQVLTWAAALEQNSEHPIATGITQKAKELKLTLPAINEFKALTGKGIMAIIDGKSVKVVSPGYLKRIICKLQSPRLPRLKP